MTEAPTQLTELTDDEFATLVEEALDELPPALTENVENLLFLVEAEPDDGSDTLGYYEGTSITERGGTEYGFGELPDRIVLFRGPLTRMCASLDELREEIAITLIHELGHYHGIEEDRLHELGWG